MLRTLLRIFCSIPFQHCLCQHNSTRVYEPSTSRTIGEAVVAAINAELALKPNIAAKCVNLTLNTSRTEDAELVEFMPQGERRLFRANIYVEPSGGLYDSYAEVRPSFHSYLINNTNRRDFCRCAMKQSN